MVDAGFTWNKCIHVLVRKENSSKNLKKDLNHWKLDLYKLHSTVLCQSLVLLLIFVYNKMEILCMHLNIYPVYLYIKNLLGNSFLTLID